MEIGVVYPQLEIGADAGAIRAFAQGAESLGYTHILAYDHVLGAGRSTRPDWKGPYDLDSPFMEPFVLFSYLAGVTRDIGFATGVMILPQRQTVLVAKQAACLDVVTGGRFRLGVGVGWNDVEYEALGVDFHDRGKRYEEQLEVLRALWATRAVTVDKTYHTINDAGINPLPHRPVPLWMGGGSPGRGHRDAVPELVLRRIARVADGWMPLWQPDDEGRRVLEIFRRLCREIGRDGEHFPVEGRSNVHRANESRWPDIVRDWQGIGASHLSIVTQRDGLDGVDQHLRRLEEFRTAIPAARGD